MKAPSKEQLDKFTEILLNIVKYNSSENTQKVLIRDELIHLLYILKIEENNENQKPNSIN